MLLLNRIVCRFHSPGSLHSTRHIISLYFNPHSLQFLLMLSIVPKTALQPKHICCLRVARIRRMLPSRSSVPLPTESAACACLVSEQYAQLLPAFIQAVFSFASRSSQICPVHISCLNAVHLGCNAKGSHLEVSPIQFNSISF